MYPDLRKCQKGFQLNRLLYIPFLLILCGCKNAEPLLVFCDPWLEETADIHLKNYSQSHPGFSYQLKVISSEVIAAHIRYGQPVDVVYAANPELVKLSRKQEVFSDSLSLGDERVMHFKRRGSANVSWDNQCLAIAASGTALRNFSEQWLGKSLNPDSSTCSVYPEIFSLMKEYLSRGFVNEGLAFSSLSKWVTNLEIMGQGPEIKDFYQLHCLSNGRNPNEAKLYLAQAGKEISQ